MKTFDSYHSRILWSHFRVQHFLVLKQSCDKRLWLSKIVVLLEWLREGTVPTLPYFLPSLTQTPAGSQHTSFTSPISPREDSYCTQAGLESMREKRNRRQDGTGCYLQVMMWKGGFPQPKMHSSIWHQIVHCRETQSSLMFFHLKNGQAPAGLTAQVYNTCSITSHTSLMLGK